MKADVRVALDTSALIALVSPWHEAHEATLELLEGHLDRGARLMLPAPTLIESYSVLTRLPAPHRLSPESALRLLRSNFASALLETLRGKAIWGALAEASERRVAGGRTYDWLIARTAESAGASHLVTLNPRHFKSFETETLSIQTPILEA